MRAKKLAGLIAIGLVASLLVPSAATASSTSLGEDEAGDWGANVDPELGPIGDVLGQDLIGAAIAMPDKKTLEFVIQLNSLPPIGGMPEVSRYVWDLEVDGDYVQLDGKFTNYSRGVCDPTSGACPPPRDPGTTPFFVRGNCGVTEAGASITTCEELAIVEGVFDAGEATITIPVPMETINAKPGSKVTPGPSIFGGSLMAGPSAFLTMAAFPMDTMSITKTFVVPGGKKKKKRR